MSMFDQTKIEEEEEEGEEEEEVEEEEEEEFRSNCYNRHTSRLFYPSLQPFYFQAVHS